MGNTLFGPCPANSQLTIERCIMKKLLASISILQLALWIIAIMTVWRYRQQLFQVRCRILISTLLSFELIFIVMQYSLGLPTEYKFVFMIFQEIFKIASFLYCIYFYLKNALYFIHEDSAGKFINWMRVSMLGFLMLLSTTLFVWVALRLTEVVTKDPCFDWIWLIYRCVTLLLIASIISVGVYIQRKVRSKTKMLFDTEDDKSDPIEEPKPPKTTMQLLSEDTQTELIDHTVNNTTVLKRKLAIEQGIKKMWFWFSFIITVCAFDVAYNIYWQINNGANNCYSYTNNEMVNAIIFFFARFISLLLPFFPILSSFLGRELLWVLVCCCCFNIKRRATMDQEESNSYSEGGKYII